MAKHGGSRAPDGRPAVAPGIGKTARRHDLEQPKTPGLAGTDLQSGDVGEFTQGQRIQPIPGGGSRPKAVDTSKPRRTSSGTEGTPDPIEFINEREGGQPFQTPGGAQPLVDPTPWLPLIEAVAKAPGSGGAVGAALVKLLAMKGRQVMNPQATVIDRQELDHALGG